jgi:tripartite-type tricarboxylate transporter receptor subunit TctC
MKEQGYDVDITGWMALGAPAGVPKERLGIIFEAFKVASNDPQVKTTMDNMMLSAPYVSGEEVKRIYQRRALEWKPLLEAMKK